MLEEPSAMSSANSNLHVKKVKYVDTQRAITAIRIALAVIAATLLILFPEPLPFVPYPINILVPLFAGRLIGITHFLGASLYYLRSLIYAGIISLSIGSLSLFIMDGNPWVGVACLFVSTFLIFAWNSVYDPAGTRMYAVKFALMDLLFICVFNPTILKAETQHPTWIVPLSLMVVQCLVYALCSALLVAFVPAPTLANGTLAHKIAKVMEALSVKLDNLLLLVCLAQPHTRYAQLPSESQQNSRLAIQNQESQHRKTADSTLPETRDDSSVESQKQKLLREISASSEKISKKLQILQDMCADLKQESWLPQPIINAHLALVGDVEVIADHLNGMADSFDGGFNERITNKVVKPMVPILSSLRQIFHTHFVDHAAKVKMAPESRSQEETRLTTTADSSSTVTECRTLKETCEKVAAEYNSIVAEFQNEAKIEVSPTPEVARFNYFLWLLLNLRKPLKRLIQHSQELSKATADADPASCSWFSKQIKYRAFACVLPFIEIFEAVKWWIVLLWDGIFRCNPDGFKDLLSKVSDVIIQRRWVYALRMALGLTSLSALCYLAAVHIEMDIRPVWSSITFIFVTQPSLGGTISKGLQRAIGTLCGALSGYLAREAVAAAHMPSYAGSMAMITGFVALFAAISTYVQHGSERALHYPYLVAVYAFQVIVFGDINQGEAQITSDWVLAALRFGHVLLGDIYSTIFGVIFSDRAFTALGKTIDEILAGLSEILDKLVLHVPDQPLTNSDKAIQNLVSQIRTKKKKLRNLLLESQHEVFLRSSKLLETVEPLVVSLEAISDHVITMLQIIGKTGWTQQHVTFMAPCLPLLHQLKLIWIEDIDRLREYIQTKVLGQKPKQKQINEVALEEGLGATQHSAASSERLMALIRELDKARAQVALSARRQRIWHEYANSELVRWNAYLHIIRDMTLQWAKIRQNSNPKSQ